MPKELFEEMWETISQNKVWQGEIKNLRKDGTFYWVYANISSVYDDNGNKTGYTAIRQNITDKKKLEEISITDGLTHIYNRRYFNDIFPKLLSSSKRNDNLICFLLMDIDYFKQYNDNYGHQMGDEVLIKFAQCLKENSKRSDDMAFRLGGEEFGIIFKAQDKEKAFEFALHIKQSIASMKIPHEYSKVTPYITASMGLVCEKGLEIHELDALYKHADELLYVSKHQGRNTITMN
jgi:diguanylate cyclase (GGDEF)-like protein